jgi:hypothetical protein
MLILAFILSAVLIILAAFHMLWGFGFWIPWRDEARLVAAVVGARDVDRMPGPIPCGIVTALLLVVAIVIWGNPHWSQTVILGIAALVFILRGLASYNRFWRKMTPEEPFATYDRRYYGPLCLVLGVGLAAILSNSF